MNIFFHARPLIALACLLLARRNPAFPQAAQPDEAAVIRGVDAAVKARVDAIDGYTVTERYNVYRNGDQAHPAAQRTVKTTYKRGVGKSYQILSDTGSSMVRKFVLDAILDNEQRINQPGTVERSYIVSANYEMHLKSASPQSMDGRNCYVLSIRPHEKAPNLIVGTLWVDTKDESIVRLEGVASKSVSVFTGPTQVMRQYVPINGFSEATHASGTSSSMLLGQTMVTIDYENYEIQVHSGR